VRMDEPVKEIKKLLIAFKGCDYKSFDHYDFWSSDTGMFLRKIKSPLTMPLVGTAYVLEVLFPRLFRLGIKKEIALETLPNLLSTLSRYRELSKDNSFEDDRKKLFKHLLNNLGSSNSGKGLGHQFNWYTTSRLPAFTPCIPHTAGLVKYIFDEKNGVEIDDSINSILKDLANFIFLDVGKKELDGDRTALAYAEIDKRFVLNANSYSAIALLHLGKHFSNDDYLQLSKKVMNFILGEQNNDGSWFYFQKGSLPDKENFIDCFHSAFLLENLLEYLTLNDDIKVMEAFQKGMEQFKKMFINPDYSVNHFAVSHLPIRIVDDTRSYAETINLLSLSSKLYSEHLDIAGEIYKKIKGAMFDETKHYYYHRRYGFALSKMNFLRWAGVPMAEAICNYAKAKSEQGA